MAISERIQLLGTYENIPPELSVSCILTKDELNYVGDESYVDLMLGTIFPKMIAETIEFDDLLEVDFHWICRCLRILSFGSTHTTNSIFCNSCHSTSYGEYKVNLQTVKCIPLPPDMPQVLKVTADEFIAYSSDIFFRMLTVKDMKALMRDPIFIRDEGRIDYMLGQVCYMITGMSGHSNLTPTDVLDLIKRDLISADFRILKGIIGDKTNYGLRSTGQAQCPRCKSYEASFIALADDRYYVRPWEIHGNGRSVIVGGKEKSYREIRQQMYENIVDETLFISRASEGAISADWLMTQPIFLRKKYVESMSKELSERERSLKNNKGKRTPR